MVNKVVLTGGHAATSALAVIEKIQELHPKWDIVWIGSNRAFSKETATTLDFQLFPKMSVKCYSVRSGKLQRNISIEGLIDLVKVPIGFFQSLYILSKERPSIVLSFGGYAALPVTWAAWLRNIPVLVHEQTVALGLANKMSLPFTKEILLSRDQSQKYFRGKKSRLVGLPLHKALINIKRVKKTRPEVIYITGGSRGSRIINQTVKELLPELLQKYSIIHQTGSLDEEELLSFAKSLSAPLQKKYIVKAHIMPQDVADIYAKADIVIARSGAHTVAEVIALNKAAVFIPIPWVQMNEQYLNAELAKKLVDAEIVPEVDFTKETLLGAINRIEDSWKGRDNIEESDISKGDKNAANEIVNVLEEYVQ